MERPLLLLLLSLTSMAIKTALDAELPAGSSVDPGKTNGLALPLLGLQAPRVVRAQ